MTSHSRHGTSRGGKFDLDGSMTLSQSGAARRDSLLPFLQEAVVREGGRRRARRIVMRNSAAFSLLLVFGATLIFSWPTRVPKDDVFVQVHPIKSVVDEPSHIVRLDTPPGVVERYASSATVDLDDYRVDDRKLVAVLASMGRSTGLVRKEGRVMLTSFKPDPIRLAQAQDDSSLDGTTNQ